LGLPPGVLENERISEFEDVERKRGIAAAGRNLWLSSPYYGMKWTYFHRPGAWNRMGTTGKFEWHGLVGFKTLFAGERGITYGGKVRKSAATGTGWMLKAGGAGLEKTGDLIRSFVIKRTTESLATPASPFTMGYAGGQVIWPAGADIDITRGEASTMRNKTAYRISRGFRRAGVGFRTGGISGIVGTFSKPAGGLVSGIFGGALITKYMPYGNLSSAGFNQVEIDSIMQSARKSGIKGLIGAGKYGRNWMLANQYTPDMITGSLYSGLGSQAKTKAVASAFRFAGATRLMAGLSVGLNIALFGGMLASLSYSGMRALGATANRMRTDMRVPNLEFGTGYAPFNSAGAYTERQRAIQAIQSSHINGRSSIGNEAALMHEMAY
jgi:hypothetical protein